MEEPRLILCFPLPFAGIIQQVQGVSLPFPPLSRDSQLNRRSPSIYMIQPNMTNKEAKVKSTFSRFYSIIYRSRDSICYVNGIREDVSQELQTVMNKPTAKIQET
jgi:hypothetical protein